MARTTTGTFLISFVAFATILLNHSVVAQGCVRRDYNESSFVCVCNATYCDTPPSVDGPLSFGRAILISSSKAQDRFQTSNLQFVSTPTGAITNEVVIDASIEYQTILGFGGAFTDAATINIDKLSPSAQDRLLRSYYSTDGIEYGIGRVPIGGSDFSTYAYTYLDDSPGDVTLSNFSLKMEDTVYKIPYIQRAKAMSSKPIKLFSSPWSAPAWMKTNNALTGRGFLIKEYYQPWAEYFARFFEEYKALGVEFWGVTAQNEPVDGTIPGFSFNCMGWTPEEQAEFVGRNLGPTLAARGFGNIKIMIMDDQRGHLPEWPRIVLNDTLARPYVSGIGLHWYGNAYASIDLLTQTHDEFPDYFVLATEACEAYLPGERDIILGEWQRLETYSRDIINDLNHWVVGWTDWNLALDLQGGPNWAENFVDAPIVVNETADEFYKQPMYYAMGHFSKYIPEDSIRVDLQMVTEDAELTGTAAVRPDGKRTVVFLNRSDNDKVIGLRDAERGILEVNCPARSIHTIVYG